MKSVFYIHTYLVYRMKNKCKKKGDVLGGWGREEEDDKKEIMLKSFYRLCTISCLFPFSFFFLVHPSTSSLFLIVQIFAIHYD